MTGCFALPEEFGDRKCLKALIMCLLTEEACIIILDVRLEEQKLPVRGVLGLGFVFPTEAQNA